MAPKTIERAKPYHNAAKTTETADRMITTVWILVVVRWADGSPASSDSSECCIAL